MLIHLKYLGNFHVCYLNIGANMSLRGIGIETD